MKTYLLLYLFSPFLNVLVNNMSKKQGAVLIILILLICSLQTIFGINYIINLNQGFSFLWFSFFYIISAYIKKYEISIKHWALWIIYITSTLILLVFNFYPDLSNFVLFKILFSYNGLAIKNVSYCNILVVFSSISLFLLFEKIKPSSKPLTKLKFISNKIICYISSCSLGIYLIHDNNLNSYIFKNIFRTHIYSNYSTAWLYLILFSLLIMLCGIIFEMLRRLLFKFFSFIYIKIKNSLIKKT